MGCVHQLTFNGQRQQALREPACFLSLFAVRCGSFVMKI